MSIPGLKMDALLLWARIWMVTKILSSLIVIRKSTRIQTKPYRSWI